MELSLMDYNETKEQMLETKKFIANTNFNTVQDLAQLKLKEHLYTHLIKKN